MRPCFLFIFYGVASIVQAKSLGVVGEVFPVAETSLLTLIEERLQDSTFTEQVSNRVMQWADRPQALTLPHALKTHSHLYVPEVTFKTDIIDAKGHILWRKGTTLNALTQLPSYQPHWVFFNGEDGAQMRWASHEHGAKVILTGGSVRDAEKFLKQDIFFDQGGRISRQLGITQLPARVTRKDNALLIQELAIKETGDEY